MLSVKTRKRIRSTTAMDAVRVPVSMVRRMSRERIASEPRPRFPRESCPSSSDGQLASMRGECDYLVRLTK